MKEPKEIYFLPVEQLSDDAIQCIEKVFELLDAIKDDCNINNFSRRFTFIREGKAISDVAEIKKDSDGLNHIYIWRDRSMLGQHGRHKTVPKSAF